MTIQNVKRLAVIDGETLMDTRLPRRSFCIETLLPEGISMLGGAPKVGKSWMVLLLALQVAKGEPLWNLPTKQGTVLYLALEDSQSRLQDSSTDSRTKPLPRSSSRRQQARLATNCVCKFPNSSWNIPIPCSSSSTPFKSFATVE